jgi:hypothetical protein
VKAGIADLLNGSGGARQKDIQISLYHQPADHNASSSADGSARAYRQQPDRAVPIRTLGGWRGQRPYEIYLIRSDIGEHGGAIPKGY